MNFTIGVTSQLLESVIRLHQNPEHFFVDLLAGLRKACDPFELSLQILGGSLESLQDASNTYIDRWLGEWEETSAKLTNMLDAYEKLVKHRQMQQEASE